jgi:mono/diheme cytochrome c family protein
MTGMPPARSRAGRRGERGRGASGTLGAARALALASLLGSTGVVACAEREGPCPPVTLAGVDSVLVELGGKATAALERGQRWRMVSSIGTGLPPSLFKPEDLPEPRSRGAGLLRVYCVQCHWIPAPQMHAAAEWPVLVRRMLMRARTLHARLGGPLTEGLVGDILLSGMRTPVLPAPEHVDTLLAYLQKHALPVARPEELTDGPDRDLFVEKCSTCHETPSPRAHTAAGWPAVVARMRANMAAMDVPPLTDAETDRIVAYLSARAADAR